MINYYREEEKKMSGFAKFTIFLALLAVCSIALSKMYMEKNNPEIVKKIETLKIEKTKLEQDVKNIQDNLVLKEKSYNEIMGKLNELKSAVSKAEENKSQVEKTKETKK